MLCLNYDTDDYSVLDLYLKENWGCKIEFDNGCILFLEVDNFAIWGTNPYGLDRCFNHSQGWIDIIISWLEYWDDHRDEWGNEINIT